MSTSAKIKLVAALVLLASCERPAGKYGLDFSGSEACHEAIPLDNREPRIVHDEPTGQFLCAGTWFLERTTEVHCLDDGNCAVDADCATSEVCACTAIDNHDEPTENGGGRFLNFLPVSAGRVPLEQRLFRRQLLRIFNGSNRRLRCRGLCFS